MNPSDDMVVAEHLRRHVHSAQKRIGVVPGIIDDLLPSKPGAQRWIPTHDVGGSDVNAIGSAGHHDIEVSGR